jgi:hypothetical protein
MMSTPAATSVERVREKRHADLDDHLADAGWGADAHPVPEAAPLLGLLEAADAPEGQAHQREDDVPSRPEEVRGTDDDLGQHGQVSAKLREDPDEDRDEEEEHADQDEGRERQNHDRVHHRALHSALDLRFLLDLVSDPVENDVEDSSRLPGLDHRDEEAREDPRMTGHCLGEQEPALHVDAEIGNDHRELLVLGLLLEDDERRHDVETCLDHRGELPREDLEGLGLDLPDGNAAGLLR